VPATTGRTRGRQAVRSGAPGAVGEHLPKITTAAAAGLAVITLFLILTKPGRIIDAATQHFMLYYAGVFALIALAAAVAVGLVATDRIILTPGHRVMAQAVHRAVSLGAVAFLIIHIVTEILAQRSHVIDSVIPFLSPYRTFYIGLGTISSDLILLIIVTSIFRKRFTAHGKAWRWRAIHYSSYVAFVFGVLHGLLGGRAAKPYVDWSYGFTIALTALAVAVRFLVISLRSKVHVNMPRDADRAAGGLGYSGASPLRTAALRMAQAQLGGTLHPVPAAVGLPGAVAGRPGLAPWADLPAPRGWPASSGPMPALSAAPASAADSHRVPAGPRPAPLSAPVYADAATVGTAAFQYSGWDAQQPPGSPGAAAAGRQTWHEPGYDGPPRFVGAPRRHLPQDDLSSYPYAPASLPPGRGAGTGPLPRVDSGPLPRVDSGPASRFGTGPMPRADTGPVSRGAGPLPGTGPMPRADTGALPRIGGDPGWRPAPGPMPPFGTGPRSRTGSGPVPWGASGPVPPAGTGPMPRVGTGPVSRSADNPPSRTDAGSAVRPGPNPDPRTATGSMAAAPRHRRAGVPHPRSRAVPGRSGGDEWR
jgi:DMSO/TMAO reductase YedYZ heme-binding membrane subunit